MFGLKTFNISFAMKVLRYLKPGAETIVNFILVIGLSSGLGIALDFGISFYITYHYRKSEIYALLDAPKFQTWKEPIHHGLLLYTWVLFSFLTVIWRYVEELTSIEFFQVFTML